jgi:3-oxoacid CoA-transferase subunit A
MANKIYESPAAALQGVLFDGMTIMSGGFGLSGNPEGLIAAIRDAGVKKLTVISNKLWGGRLRSLVVAWTPARSPR